MYSLLHIPHVNGHVSLTVVLSLKTPVEHDDFNVGQL
jgi:hypothetical protein